jgi:hypothetical protein
MRARRCTIDSSCLIAPDHLGLTPQLSILFEGVLVPRALREEVFKREQTKDRLQSLFDTYAYSQPCDGYEQGAVDLPVAERSRQGMQDRGPDCAAKGPASGRSPNGLVLGSDGHPDTG